MNTINTTDEIKAALVQAAAAPSDVTFTLFTDGITDTHGGETVTKSFAEIAQYVAAASTTLWPSAEALVRKTSRISEDLTQRNSQIHAEVAVEDEAAALKAAADEADEAFDTAVKDAKNSLPVVVFAKFTAQAKCDRGHVNCIHRTDDAVEWLSALFIDLDEGFEVEQVAALRRLLTDANISHIATESATSRLKRHDGAAKPTRIHLYVPLRPLVLPLANRVDRAKVKERWQKLYATTVKALTAAAGVAGFDASVDDLSQPIFLPHAPPNSPSRQLKKLVDGQFLDLEAFAAALGVDVEEAPQLAETTEAQPLEQLAQTQQRRATASAGPTPGHSTGSLLLIAFKSLNRLGNCLDATARKYAVQCPWCDSHKSDPRQKLGHFKNDSSTVIYDDIGRYGHDGGFECKHNGNGVLGECSQASAADVLSWARKKGANIPNRPEWGGAAAVEADTESDEATVKPKAKRSKDSRPRIVVRVGDVAGMRDQAIAALSRRCDIFVRDGMLVDLTPAGPRTMPADHLLAVLGEAAAWVSASRSEEGEVTYKPTKVPRDVVGAVLKSPHWPGVAELRAVVKHPPLLPDGRLITTPGYDAESKLLYLPDKTFNVPSRPSRDDATAAKGRLLQYVRNTNFCDANGPSVWLSFVLTLAARTAVPTVPIVGFDAAVAGAGKTSLVKIAYGLIHGELPQLGAPVVDDDAEAEKRLPTWARQPLVVWDNVKHTFGSPVVDGAITAGRATTRRLGANESMAFDFTSTSWAMTGNNLAVGDDAASRCVIARIQAPTSRRYDFAVDDVTYYRANRPQAVADALTILRAFFLAGQPQHDGPYCRFVEWSRLIRQAILWLGMPDPVGGEVVDSSLEGKAIAMRALAQWRRYHEGGDGSIESAFLPFHAADIDTTPIKPRSEDDESFHRRRAVVDALAAVYGKRVEGAVKAGHALQKLRDAEVPADGGGSVRFVVEKVGAKTAYRLVREGIEGESVS